MCHLILFHILPDFVPNLLSNIRKYLMSNIYTILWKKYVWRSCWKMMAYSSNKSKHAILFVYFMNDDPKKAFGYFEYYSCHNLLICVYYNRLTPFDLLLWHICCKSLSIDLMCLLPETNRQINNFIRKTIFNLLLLDNLLRKTTFVNKYGTRFCPWHSFIL